MLGYWRVERLFISGCLSDYTFLSFERCYIHKRCPVPLVGWGAHAPYQPVGSMIINDIPDGHLQLSLGFPQRASLTITPIIGILPTSRSIFLLGNTQTWYHSSWHSPVVDPRSYQEWWLCQYVLFLVDYTLLLLRLSHRVWLLSFCFSHLVGGLEHVLFFPIVGMMIQSGELIFFRGVQSGNLT